MEIQFPLDTRFTVEDITSELSTLVPACRGNRKGTSLLRATLPGPDTATIMGYGRPYQNPETRAAEDWILRDATLPDGQSLRELVGASEFLIYVARNVQVVRRDTDLSTFPGAWEPPYDMSSWNVQAILDNIEKNQGPRLPARYQ